MSDEITTANRRRKEFTVAEWKDRLRNGIRFQDKFGQARDWPRYRSYYRHEFKGNNVIPVNLYFSHLRSLVPQLYYRNPQITVTPRRPGLLAELNARIVQWVDNWLIRELMLKYEMKRMIEDAFLCGNGTGFLGYDSEFGFDPSLADPSGQYTLSQFDKRGYRLEYSSIVNPGMPWFLRAQPEDVIWPWGTRDQHSAEWVALRVFRPLDDIKLDPKYSNTSGLAGTHVPIRSGPETSTPSELESYAMDRDRKWAEIYQIHDARTGEVLALNMDHDKLLRKDSDEMQIDGLPVETFGFNPDPEYIYSVPDGRIIEPQQLELNEIRTQAMKHRRLDIIKFLAREGAISDDEIQKMTDEQVASVVRVNADDQLGNIILPFTANAAGILQDMAFAAEQVRSDVRETVGFSRIAQGEFQGKTHISATETKAVSSALNIRLDERRDIISDSLSRIVRRFNQIIFTKWDKERVANIVGPDGAQWWVKFNGSQIKDEYDLTITPEEGPSLDTNSKFDMAERAALAWAQMNQGQIAQGVPVPAEIQRLLFGQFRSSGLDIDRLLNQSNQANQSAQQALGALGQSQDSPVSPGVLANALGGS